jgi:hypothetical protein
MPEKDVFVGEGALGPEPDLFIVEVDGESVDVCALSCPSGTE